jgi:solute carrier family 34 (sodium-dependent phosphate cotransporter)
LLEPELPIKSSPPPWSNIVNVLYIIGTLVLFVFALDLMVSSLQHLGASAAETILMATSNPFTGLFIGLLITAMLQSSSTTTALVVAFVASGSISLQSAIPIIMGANMGTTITSTIVSLGFINRKKEFRRAVAAGTYHDFFNLLTVVILFPLQQYYGFLSFLSEKIVSYFYAPVTQSVHPSFSTGWSGFNSIIEFLVNTISNGFVLVLLSFTLLFSSILIFRKLISGLLLASSPERFSRFFFKNPGKSFFWGIITTAAIRSSTITTSVVVPIVAQKIVPLPKAVPFILGANIGTTITAFIAATFNANTSSAISIAIAHFLFNFIGFLIFYPIPVLRNIPIALANGLGKLTLRYRLVGFVYILMTFFFIPFSLIYLNKGGVEVAEFTCIEKNYVSGIETTSRIISKMRAKGSLGECIVYGNQAAEPSMIYPVSIKNNILFINQDMYLFNKPGFCWDGENKAGKFQFCIEQVMPKYEITGTITFDSVYVFVQRYYSDADSTLTRFYINKQYPVVLKRELIQNNALLESTSVSGFSTN